ncbi:methyltransferase [Streptomyces sp. CRN 30]|uniref:methyltransferase n=1 Tax=Streptomyces sp. CRN 30 TaxID=3075613 RepID=UPI002A812796|nr:methyltransferase [Streptomyces sp. CRN 30]
MTTSEKTVSATPGAPLDDAFDIMLIGWSFMRSKLLMTAMDMGVFEALSKEQGTAAQITERLGLNERGVPDFLDSLTALGLLSRDAAGVYANGPAAARNLIPGQQGYVGGFLRMTSGFLGADPESLANMLRTGDAHGQDAQKVPFAQIFRDPERLRQFLSAMDSLNSAIGPELARVYDWSRHTSFVDIGGARGNLAGTLLQAHPHLRGGVFDRPVMKPFLEELADERGVLDRMTFHGGDFYHDEIPGADVVIFGNVLHDTPVATRKGLIAQAAARVPAGGAVIVYDPMIDDDRRDADTLLMSLTMMMQSPAGNEYTPAECRGWMEEAGLEVEEVLRLPAHGTAVVGRKRA